MYEQQTKETNTKAEILAELLSVVVLLNEQYGLVVQANEASDQSNANLVQSQQDLLDITSTLAVVQANLDEKSSDLAKALTDLANANTSITNEASEEAFESKISVVIPFACGNDETHLLYLLRSIEKEFTAQHHVVIIGQKPAINLSDDVAIIELESKTSNKELNLVHILQAAALSEIITDNFIVAPMDTYFISPVTFADIALLKTSKPKVLSLSDETALENTLRLLSDKGIENARNFTCGLPFAIEKAKFAGLFAELPELDAIPSFIESIYFNYNFRGHSAIELDHTRDNIRLNFITAAPNVEKVKELIANKKFVSVWESAKGDFSENYLNVKFAEKCSLELE
ncbi:MAG: hypothetical protein PHV20_12405 [Bacteroidales bacterium]|nr:hypothetical protein [Bacteroidales bacterium]